MTALRQKSLSSAFFPLKFKNLLLFAFLWLLVGFTLGTITLNGPVRWVVNLGWPKPAEDWSVRLIILLFVVLSFSITVWFTRGILRSRLRHVHFGIPLIALLCTSGVLFYWLNPQLFGSAPGLANDEVGQFTFGPYPTPRKMAELKAQGFTAVISLLHPAVVPFEPKLLADEKKNARESGLQLIHLPMLPWVSDNINSLDSVKILAGAGKGKYYVHCYLGRDRVRVVSNIVSRFGHNQIRDNEIHRSAEMNIAGRESFERGKIVELDSGYYLTPYPTDEEYIAFIVNGDFNHVVSLMDSTQPADRSWIEKERQLLKQYQISFRNLPVSVDAFDPMQVLQVVGKVRLLEPPVLIHGFLSRGIRWESFIQAFRSHLSPLPPSRFQQPLSTGPVKILAPNIAAGPRPAGPEFGNLLFANGVRHFLYLGQPDTPEAQEDRSLLRAAGLSWQTFTGKTMELYRKIETGGPWYLYGPGLKRFEEIIAHDLGPAIPDSCRVNRQKIGTAGSPEASTDFSGGFLAKHIRVFWDHAFPGLFTLIMFTPVFILYTALAAAFAGWLRCSKEVRTPYTRKVFHLFIFTMASILQFTLGLSAVVLFGSIVSAGVLYAVYRGNNFPFYECMARPTDAPHRSLFILIPLLTTALGGVTANLFFPQFAYIGYLVGGWGDAVGEPVGTRWGKHKYRVPSLVGVKATRSLEGSAAVLLVGGLVAFIGFFAGGLSATQALSAAGLCALAATAVEAVSNHGLDNFTIQVTAAAVAYFFVG